VAVTGQETPAAGNAGEAFVAVVEELREFLARDGLSMDDVANRIGNSAGGDPRDAIEVQPRLAGLRTVQVLAYPDTGLPYLVTLEPEDSAMPTPSELQSRFGDYTRQPTHFGAPRELIFTGRTDTGPWRVVLLAEAEPLPDLNTSPITRITFRRDPPS
jgi:hypothetical protein